MPIRPLVYNYDRVPGIRSAVSHIQDIGDARYAQGDDVSLKRDVAFPLSASPVTNTFFNILAYEPGEVHLPYRGDADSADCDKDTLYI